MAASKIFGIVMGIFCIMFLLWWFGHLIGCLARRDFRASDKFFWFFVLLIPILGIILYRGLGKEFYKKD